MHKMLVYMLCNLTILLDMQIKHAIAFIIVGSIYMKCAIQATFLYSSKNKKQIVKKILLMY